MSARSELRAAISDAYYEARNEGRTMESAADVAVDAVLEVFECERSHCDAGDCPPCEYEHVVPEQRDRLVDWLTYMYQWHDSSDHEGPFRFCAIAPCAPFARSVSTDHV